LRTRLAEAAKTDPRLHAALAAAAGVSEQTDLVAAAKAAAVIETLDEIAQNASQDFELAREALRAGPAAGLADQGLTPEEIEATLALRKTHAKLNDQWMNRKLTPREMRLDLVKYYIRAGQAAVNARFFRGT